MLAYPQLTSNALVQLPIQKTTRKRTLTNLLGDSSSLRLSDPNGGQTEWRLEYEGLSDDEISLLERFFETTEGSLTPFTFLDPTANLFAWSDSLDNSVWARGPLLHLTAGQSDPLGGQNGWVLTNSGGGAQSISQSLAVPGGYTYCLSAYLRSSQPLTTTLYQGSQRQVQISRNAWARFTNTAQSDSAAEFVEFGLELPPFASVEVFGLQVEAQAGASPYKSSKTCGVYENSTFSDDEFSYTTTDVNRHSTIVTIIHADHL